MQGKLYSFWSVREIRLHLYRPANDPRTANDPQIGPEMISINDTAKNQDGIDSMKSPRIYMRKRQNTQA